MIPVKPVRMRSRALWRRCLERHHAGKTEVWLTCFKAHTGKPCVTYGEAVEEALCFGWIDGQVQGLDDESWAQRFTPRRKGSAWSKVNLRRFARLTAEGLVTDAGRAAGPTRDTRVAEAFWERPDVSPPEVKAALNTSAAAWTHFQALPAYKRKLYVTWDIGQAARDRGEAHRRGHRHARTQ